MKKMKQKKIKQKKMRKIGIASALGLVVLVVLGLYGACLLYTSDAADEIGAV